MMQRVDAVNYRQGPWLARQKTIDKHVSELKNDVSELKKDFGALKGEVTAVKASIDKLLHHFHISNE